MSLFSGRGAHRYNANRSPKVIFSKHELAIAGRTRVGRIVLLPEGRLVTTERAARLYSLSGDQAVRPTYLNELANGRNPLGHQSILIFAHEDQHHINDYTGSKVGKLTADRAAAGLVSLMVLSGSHDKLLTGEQAAQGVAQGYQYLDAISPHASEQPGYNKHVTFMIELVARSLEIRTGDVAGS